VVAEHGGTHDPISGEYQPTIRRRAGILGDDDFALWPGFLLADRRQFEPDSLDDGRPQVGCHPLVAAERVDRRHLGLLDGDRP